MNKVYVVEQIWEYDGQVDTKIEVFSNLDKAKEQKQKWIDDARHFIEDIQSYIDNGNIDSHIDNEEKYFYAYDSLNFEALTIVIEEKEIL